MACVAQVKGKQISFILHPAALQEDCTRGDVIIVTWPLNSTCSKDAIIIDKRALREKGAHALYIKGDQIHIETAADHRGKRYWSQKP